MTAQELADAKVDLAAAEAALRKRVGGKELQSATSTGEGVVYAKATVNGLRDIINELETAICCGNPYGLGALLIR